MTTPAADDPAARRAPAKTLGLAAICDIVVICVFAAVGRSSHDEHLGVSGVWQTAWPFLVGAAIGWLITLAVARGRAPVAGAFTGWSPERLWPAGVVIWISTVVIGMLVRSASGGGVAAAFVVVASIATAVLLLGWRLLAAVVRSRRPNDVAADSAP
ncbi:DUF3054 domain-containing protein [Gordonia caeni]|uniref:DUF3054 domain-containing protein n=1 Tax=Gordonia caeni TaxID=1007097 RepID=A0ABP7NMM5_9ACTN